MRAFAFAVLLLVPTLNAFSTLQRPLPAFCPLPTPTSLRPVSPLFSSPNNPDASPPNDGPLPPRMPRHRRILSSLNPLKTKKNNDEVPLKEKLLKLGLAAFLSYGFVSNMTYAVMLSLAYFVFTSKTGEKCAHADVEAGRQEQSVRNDVLYV